MDITNENRPVTFKLPDDDEVSLIPWKYVIDRLTVDLQDTVSQLQMINTSLTAIDTKLSDWIEEE
jgi:hypothetical protein